MRRTLGVVLAMAMTLGCAESREAPRWSVPGIEGSRPLHTLSRDEWLAVCEWSEEYQGVEVVECDDGTIRHADADDCVLSYAPDHPSFMPSCRTTVADWAECRVRALDSCFSTGDEVRASEVCSVLRRCETLGGR